jgi:hypothetical protein
MRAQIPNTAFAFNRLETLLRNYLKKQEVEEVETFSPHPTPPPPTRRRQGRKDLPRQKEGGRPHAQLAVHVELEPGRGHLRQAGTKVGRQVGGQRPDTGKNSYLQILSNI